MRKKRPRVNEQNRVVNDNSDEEMSRSESRILGMHDCDKDSFVQDVWDDDQTHSSLSGRIADNVK